MKDFLHIGAAPAEEDCVQLGAENYSARASEECRRFIALIRKRLGQEPPGARLRVGSFPHDFGTYKEVVCDFDDEIPASVEYAFKVEAEAPSRWEE